MTDTKTRLSQLLDRAAAGEEIVVTRSGKPIARIAPLAEKAPRPFGVAKHWPEIPETDLVASMDESDLKWAEGTYTDEVGVTKRPRRAPRKRQGKKRPKA